MMINLKELQSEINGSFDNVDNDTSESILALMALYHLRNGVKHDDGSIGEIRITPGQFRDLIAYKTRNDTKQYDYIG